MWLKTVWTFLTDFDPSESTKFPIWMRRKHIGIFKRDMLFLFFPQHIPELISNWAAYCKILRQFIFCLCVACHSPKLGSSLVISAHIKSLLCFYTVFYYCMWDCVPTTTSLVQHHTTSSRRLGCVLTYVHDLEMKTQLLSTCKNLVNGAF